MRVRGRGKSHRSLARSPCLEKRRRADARTLSEVVKAVTIPADIFSKRARSLSHATTRAARIAARKNRIVAQGERERGKVRLYLLTPEISRVTRGYVRTRTRR